MATKRVAVWDNIKFFLMMLVVIGHMASVDTGNSRLFRAVFVMIWAFHMPLFIFISGLFHKNTKIKEKIITYVSIYFVMQIVLFIYDYIMRGQRTFTLFSAAVIPWFVFCIAVFIALTYILRDVRPQYVLVLAFLLGTFSGYDKSLGDLLCLSRIIVYYPFYYLGSITSKDKLEKIIATSKYKVCGLAVMAFWCLLCVYKTDALYSMRSFLTGRNAFPTSLENAFVYRIISYVMNVVLGLSFMLCIPCRDLKSLTVFGSRTLQIYFWHLLLRNSLVHLQIYVNYFSHSLKMRILWLVLGIPVTFLFSLKIFSFPTKQLQSPLIQNKKMISESKN